MSRLWASARQANGDARNFFDGLPTKTALTLCDSCYSIIRQHGAAAVDAVNQGRIDENVENTVEATVLLSGLGFESGGLALAHSLTRGLTAQAEVQNALHGELVAWGLLVQLVAEGRSRSFIEDILTFYHRLGLPTRLEDLGFSNPDQSTISDIATTTHREAPYVANMRKKMSAEGIVKCINDTESLTSPDTR